MKAVYYHNSRCSKSRQGLALLEEKNIDFKVKEYLKEKLTQGEILNIIKFLEISPLDGLIRVKESVFKELSLKGQKLTNSSWAKIIVDNPILLERPILVIGDKAKIGRPPTNLLEIL